MAEAIYGIAARGVRFFDIVNKHTRSASKRCFYFLSGSGVYWGVSGKAGNLGIYVIVRGGDR